MKRALDVKCDICKIKGLRRLSKWKHKVSDPELGVELKLCDKCYEQWKILNDMNSEYEDTDEDQADFNIIL